MKTVIFKNRYEINTGGDLQQETTEKTDKNFVICKNKRPFGEDNNAKTEVNLYTSGY